MNMSRSRTCNGDTACHAMGELPCEVKRNEGISRITCSPGVPADMAEPTRLTLIVDDALIR
jgi:hypothetical protein